MLRMRPHWAVGEALGLAQAFFKATEEQGRSLGSRAYMRFVAAIASASVHNTLAQAVGNDDETKQHVRNILLTAKTVEQLVVANLPSEGDSDDSAGSSSESAGDAEEDLERRGNAKQGTPPLESLTAVIEDITTSSPGTQRQPLGTVGGAPQHARGMRCLLLSLPDGLLQSLMSLLDGRSAAAASLACKQLSLVHRVNRYFELSAPFRSYLAAVLQLQQDDFSDGSVESHFCAHFPLDGSPACGQDLAAESYSRRMRAMMPEMAQLFAVLGGGPGGRSLQEFKSSIAGMEEQQAARPPPHPLSTPLAFFKDAKAVSSLALPSSSSAGAAEDAVATAAAAMFPAAAGPSSAAAAASGVCCLSAAASGVCCLSAAVCDVQEIRGVPSGRMHCDGDLVSVAYTGGWKQQRDLRGPGPGLTALALSTTGTDVEYDDLPRYDHRHGLPSYATRVCSDSSNGLVWAATDNGRRIAAFRAQTGPATTLAGCNRGEANGMALQYTLCSEVGGLAGRHAGLHVIGTRVVSVKGNGAVLVWDVANMPPQAPRPNVPLDVGFVDRRGSAGSARSAGPGRNDDDGAGGGTNRGDAARHIGTEDPPVDQLVGLQEAPLVGARPHSVVQLPLPSRRGDPSAASLLAALAGEGGEAIRSTCLLRDDTTGGAPTLVAALGGNVVVTYDLETQRVKQRLFGHLYEITEIAAPPAAWRQSNLFATSSRAGDVKVWDVRMRAGAAAVTLTTGETNPINAVVLAAASSGGVGGGGGSGSGVGGGGCGGGGSSSQLGAGMVCFAGGEGESVWAWDLRAGTARPLYELSTGNTAVQSLVWHEAGNSLLAACECSWELLAAGPAGREADDGSHAREDYWKMVQVATTNSGSGGAWNGSSGGSGSAGGGDGGSAVSGAGYAGSLASTSSAGGGTSSSAGTGAEPVGGPSGSSSSGPSNMMGDGDVSPPSTPPINAVDRGRVAGGDDDDGEAGGASQQLGAGAAAGGASGRRRRAWPARGKHQPGDFGQYFNMARSCVLRYRFSEQAQRAVPRSVAPSFGF